MGMLKTGGRCPKCGGNLYLEKDYIGWYEQCLQCAYMKDLAVVYQDKAKMTVKPVHIKKEEGIYKKDAPQDKS